MTQLGEMPGFVASDRWVAVRLHEDHAQADPEADSRFRPQSGTLVRGPEPGQASCWLVGETDPEVLMSDAKETLLYLVRVEDIRRESLEVVWTPAHGGPGHCDIFGTRGVSRTSLRRALLRCRWVSGYAPEGVAPDAVVGMSVDSNEPIDAIPRSC